MTPFSLQIPLYEKIKPINYTNKMCCTLCINNVSSSRPGQRAPNISAAQQKVSIFNVTGKPRGKVSGGRKQMDYSLCHKDLLWLDCMFHTLPYQIFQGWHIVYLIWTANDKFPSNKYIFLVTLQKDWSVSLL